jgi:hypothetical protein
MAQKQKDVEKSNDQFLKNTKSNSDKVKEASEKVDDWKVETSGQLNNVKLSVVLKINYD